MYDKECQRCKVSEEEAQLLRIYRDFDTIIYTCWDCFSWFTGIEPEDAFSGNRDKRR